MPRTERVSVERAGKGSHRRAGFAPLDIAERENIEDGLFLMNDYKNALPGEVDDHPESENARQLRTQADNEVPLTRQEADVAGITQTPEVAYGEASDQTEATDLREGLGGMSVLIVAREQALIDRVVSLLVERNVRAAGTTSDAEAVGRIESGEFAAMVIGGGIQPASRDRLRSCAHRSGLGVIEGRARGKDPTAYVRDELLPALRRLEQ